MELTNREKELIFYGVNFALMHAIDKNLESKTLMIAAIYKFALVFFENMNDEETKEHFKYLSEAIKTLEMLHDDIFDAEMKH